MYVLILWKCSKHFVIVLIVVLFNVKSLSIRLLKQKKNVELLIQKDLSRNLRYQETAERFKVSRLPSRFNLFFMREREKEK